MKKKIMCLVVLLLAAACFAEEYPVRTWTWKNGDTVEGHFVKTFVDEKRGSACVFIKKTDGKLTGPVLSMLSEEDQAYVKSVSK